MNTPRERASLQLLFALSLLWLYSIDALRLIQMGNYTASGLLTLFTAGVACIAVAVGAISPRRVGEVRGTRPRLPRGTWVLVLVVSAMIVARLLGTFSTEGLQNVAVYLSFFATVFAVAVQASGTWADRVGQAYRAASIAVPTIYLATTFAGWQLYNARSYAIVGVVLLAVSATSRSGRPIDRVMPFVIVLTIAMSESRTALVVAIGLLLFLTTRSHRSLRLFVAGGVALVSMGLAYWIMTSYEPIRARFTGGDNAVVGGTQINTSGRIAFWEAVWQSFLESPFWGHGPGSAAALVTSIWPSVGHPHNDYLRLLHDFGVIGFVIFMGAAIALGASVLRAARRFDKPEHWAALAVLCGLAALALTDNVLAYPFAMVPAGILVGTSLASARLVGAEPSPPGPARPQGSTTPTSRHSTLRRSPR